MTYRVELRPAARRQFLSLTLELQRRLSRHIDALAENPRPHGVRRLAGSDSLYRIRVGDYRILYAVDDGAMLVTVATIGHRRDVYR